MMKCANLHCNNTVREEDEGGLCLACCCAIEDAEDRAVEERMIESEREITELEEDGVCRLADPYEEFGFDHSWEL